MLSGEESMATVQVLTVPDLVQAIWWKPIVEFSKIRVAEPVAENEDVW
jgi:hypothetical protein